MNKNNLRIGRFTSSRCAVLIPCGKRDMTEAELAARPAKGKGSTVKTIEDPTVFSKAGQTYIDETNMERRLGRSLNNDSTARALSWGNLVERVAFDILGTSYKLVSEETISHPEHGNFWSGSPDIVKVDGTGSAIGVAEVKCPYTLKSFCTFADCIDILEVREKHPDGEQYYWQIVSNGILTGQTKAELIVFCPYAEQLEDIRKKAANFDGDQNQFRWLDWCTDGEMPYIEKGGYYRNLYTFAFEIPFEDKQLLTSRMVQASKQLDIKNYAL